MNTPEKLKKGDEIRIIAPSRSMQILSKEGIQLAKKHLEELGFYVTFGQYVETCDMQKSSSIQERIADIHDAFADKNVKGILTVIGGFNSNELLPYLDYELIQENPKIFCGFSDITALATAITAKCHFITYSGPHFSSFQMIQGQAYQTESFKKCVMSSETYTLQPSEKWSDDLWFLDQENRNFEPTIWKVYTEGEATGTLFGGNLCTLNLLQGTAYMPNLQDCILFIEDDELTIPELFARDLTSLLQVSGAIKGLLIGRFQKESSISEEQLHFILDKHPQLKNIPVLYDIDFGHTQPIMTLPIGGTITMNTQNRNVTLLEF
ncbi:S66 family peptidase [Lysinibacillus piscis]|uniref:LD-carboxypeptidase n=1 Tax=Lysinibacillus piscis TaxID=2518931 RepID=A0ABQ5NMP0_9BACI|nr:S66 peptidase family protein [Lysinibacillus sp. KH24]GLC89604.1 LD-carboxypeptidase [Lysinibacillus sp. KH24]